MPNVYAESLSQSVSVKSNDIKLTVEYQKSYSESETVPIKTLIENLSNNNIGLVWATQIYGLRIILIGPDGARVKTLPYTLDTKRNTFGKIKRNDKSEDEIMLAGYFPFEKVGEYRCRITRRVYDTSMLNVSEISLDNRGNPVDLLAPEFTFRVETAKPIERPADDANPGMLQGYVLDGIGGLSNENKNDPHDDAPNQPGDFTNASSSGHLSVTDPAKSKESTVTNLAFWRWVFFLVPVFVCTWLIKRRTKGN